MLKLKVDALLDIVSDEFLNYVNGVDEQTGDCKRKLNIY